MLTVNTSAVSTMMQALSEVAWKLKSIVQSFPLVKFKSISETSSGAPRCFCTNCSHVRPSVSEVLPVSQKLLNSSYFFIQSICGAFFFSLAWIFIFSSAAVALKPISANGSNSRPLSSSANYKYHCRRKDQQKSYFHVARQTPHRARMPTPTCVLFPRLLRVECVEELPFMWGLVEPLDIDGPS